MVQCFGLTLPRPECAIWKNFERSLRMNDWALLNPLSLTSILYTMSVPWAMLFVSLFRRDPYRKWLDVTTVMWYYGYVAIAGILMCLMVSVLPAQDPVLMRIDAALGFNTLSFAAAMRGYPVAMAVIAASYILLAPVIAVSWLLEQNLVQRRAILIGGYLTLVCYALVPAVGPGYYDWAKGVALHAAPFNCMPSMHIGFPLLLAYNARSKWLRVWLWAFVAIMLVATLALREHYLIDLIAAFPFSLGVQWIAARTELIYAKLRDPNLAQERECPASPRRGAHGNREILTPHVAE